MSISSKESLGKSLSQASHLEISRVASIREAIDPNKIVMSVLGVFSLIEALGFLLAAGVSYGWWGSHVVSALEVMGKIPIVVDWVLFGVLSVGALSSVLYYCYKKKSIGKHWVVLEESKLVYENEFLQNGLIFSQIPQEGQEAFESNSSFLQNGDYVGFKIFRDDDGKDCVKDEILFVFLVKDALSGRTWLTSPLCMGEADKLLSTLHQEGYRDGVVASVDSEAEKKALNIAKLLEIGFEGRFNSKGMFDLDEKPTENIALCIDRL